jgi:hypothetical protein
MGWHAFANVLAKDKIVRKEMVQQPCAAHQTVLSSPLLARLQGTLLVLGPLNYLFVHTFNSGKYCLGVFDNGRAGGLGRGWWESLPLQLGAALSAAATEGFPPSCRCDWGLPLLPL